jgi:hypothetical protein
VTAAGWVGVGLLVAAGLAVILEAVVAALWSLGLARRSQALAKLIESEREMLLADLERLRLAMQETERLWRPYRRVLRWLRHPLTIALWQSYRRRGILP